MSDVLEYRYFYLVEFMLTGTWVKHMKISLSSEHAF